MERNKHETGTGSDIDSSIASVISQRCLAHHCRDSIKERISAGSSLVCTEMRVQIWSSHTRRERDGERASAMHMHVP